MRLVRMIQTAYEDTYAALYQFVLRRWHGDDDTASWMTALGLAGAVCMNVALAVGVLVARYGPVPYWAGRRLQAPIVMMTILLVNYVAFIRGNRYQTLVQRFGSGERDRRVRITVLAWVYVIVSYVSVGVFVLALYWRERGT